MIPMNSNCSRCGASLEADCDFCPACGAAKSITTKQPAPTMEPHSWMQSPPVTPAPANTGSLVHAPVQPQVQYVSYAVPPSASTQESGLPVAVRTMGIVALSLTLVGLIPCLGWVNYVNFTFCFVTFVLAIVAIAGARSDAARTSAVLGLVMTLIADIVGVFRLILGGGCL
jgi:hypothetical protein